MHSNDRSSQISIAQEDVLIKLAIIPIDPADIQKLYDAENDLSTYETNYEVLFQILFDNNLEYLEIIDRNLFFGFLINYKIF